MKVLHVIDALGVGGGAEHSLAAMLPRLRERGVDSSVACIHPREGGLQASLCEQGFDVEILPGPTWLRRVMSLRRKIKHEAPDIVHATLFNSCLLSRFACAGLKICQINSIVSTPYDARVVELMGVPRWKLEVVRKIDGLTGKKLGGTFHAVSHAVRKHAIDALGIENERIFVIPRGRDARLLGERSDSRREEVRRRLGISSDTFVFLNVGRQDTAKAQAEIIRAFAIVYKECSNSVLLIAGREGNASQEIKVALEIAGINGAVKLLGHRTDIADLYAASDVFLLPSVYEGMPGSVIEAMALSVPVIGSDADAIAEVLGDGDFGVIVPRNDAQSLAEEMTQLLSDPERRRELARRGRERYLEQYELDRVVDAMSEMYAAVLATAKVQGAVS